MLLAWHAQRRKARVFCGRHWIFLKPPKWLTRYGEPLVLT
jgi:hypothetical protein